MDEYSKMRVEFADKLSAQQELVHETLQNQFQVHKNLSDLNEVFSEIESLIESLKDSKFNQMSTVFKKNQQSDKASDLLKMNLDQIIKNKNTVMRKKANLLVNSTIHQPSVVSSNIFDFDKKKDEKNIESNFPTTDPFVKTLDKIEILLVEQKIFEAVAEFKQLSENKSTSLSMFAFLKKTKFEKIIVEELKSHVAHLSTFDSIDYQIINPYVDTLLYFKKIEDAIEMVFNYTSKLFAQIFPAITISERFIKMMDTSMITVTFLKEKFKQYFPQNEFFLVFSHWLMNEYQIVLNDLVRSEKDPEELRHSLEKLKIDLGVYDMKGLNLDFLIETEIQKIQFEDEEKKENKQKENE